MIALVADAGPQAGLGHLSRSSALALALRELGLDCRCLAGGVSEPLERAGVEWEPLRPMREEVAVLVLDSYELAADVLPAERLVLFHDDGSPPSADLVVSVGLPASETGPGLLSGPEHACLLPEFQGLPERKIADSVQRVLVTVGGGAHELGAELAAAAEDALPDCRVELAAGRDTLQPALTAADLVLSAAGQTMLEAAATGAPCVALAIAANQRGQVGVLADVGAVAWVDPPEAGAAAAELQRLARDPGLRRQISRRAQQAVDGRGAARVAERVARLAP